MKAWRLSGPGGRFELAEIAEPRARAGAAVVRMEAAPVLSYMRQVVDGRLGYALPASPFTPGTNGVGIVEEVGPGVYHLKRGDRVLLSPHHVVDERTLEPAQVLIGLTAIGSSGAGDVPGATRALQADWPDGTFAEFAQLPAACLTTAPKGDFTAANLAAIGKFLVPYGGFLRGGLLGGETVIVNGASGYFGSAAVLLAAALGAARVVAAGRDGETLADVVRACGDRAVAVRLGGDVDADARALRGAAGGGVDIALDLVGRAESGAATLATLRALRRGGRLVVMGSVLQPLPISVGELLANDWTIAGCFMYPKDAPARLVKVIGAGLLDLGRCRVREFPLDALEAAMTAAAGMRGLDCVVLSIGRDPRRVLTRP